MKLDDSWELFYKIVGPNLRATNMLYTPYVNKEKNVMCQVWDETHPYQYESARLTRSLLDFFFEREVKYLTLFQGREWCPKLLEIDLEKKHIYIEFNKETLNQILFTKGRNINSEIPDWKDQIFNIMSDVVQSGYYKMAMYPHCFFLSDSGKIKTIDYYSCLESSERYLERSKIEGIIGEMSVNRFNEATGNGLIDFELFFKRTMSYYLKDSWPDNPFPSYYERIFNEKL